MSAPTGTPALRWSGRWLALGWLLLAVIVAGSLIPLKQRSGLDGIDKVEHVIGYGLLMFWFAALHPPARRLWFALAFVALGAALEFVQNASGWRRAERLDLLADVVGVALGWVLAHHLGAKLFVWVERRLGA